MGITIVWILFIFLQICRGVDPDDEICEDGNSCSTTYVFDTSDMKNLISSNRAGVFGCYQDVKTGCEHTHDGLELKIVWKKENCNTDLCNDNDTYDYELEKLPEPHRLKLSVGICSTENIFRNSNSSWNFMKQNWVDSRNLQAFEKFFEWRRGSCEKYCLVNDKRQLNSHQIFPYCENLITRQQNF